MKTDKAYRKINRITFKYIPVMFLAALSINILSLALPLTMKQIYSKIIANKSVETLTLLMLGCVIALALEALLRKTKESSSKWISAKYEHQLTTYLIGKILNSYAGEGKKAGYNANLEKFNSIARVTSYYSTGFYQLFVDLPFMILFLYLIYWLGGALVLMPLAWSFLYIIIMMVNAKLYFKNRITQIEKSDALLAQLTETLEKIHLIKASGLEQFQIARYRKTLKETTEAEFRTNNRQMLPENITAYLSQITLFSILIGGGYLMIYGGISFGEITACALLGGRAVAPVQSLMNLYQQRKDVKILRGRLDEIAAQPNQYNDDVPMFPEDIAGTIEMIDLKYTNIQNNLPQMISGRINASAFVCVNPAVFPSYVKIFNKITGKEQVEGGKILIDNLDITEWNMNSLKGKIEYLSHRVSIYKGSIMDNITYFNPSKSQAAHEAASITGLDVLVAQMPEGFETSLDSQAINYLSSAFMQRLNLTRALLIRPRILILDRIDESMDDETLQIFIWLLGKFKGRLTILVATGNETIRGMAHTCLSA